MLHYIFSYVAYLFVNMQLCFCLASLASLAFFFFLTFPTFIKRKVALHRTVTSLPWLPWTIQYFKQMWRIVNMRN